MGLCLSSGWAAGIPGVGVDPKTLRVDGNLKEWSSLTALDKAVKGSPKRADLEAKAALGYDATHLYLAVDVTDDTLKGGGGGDQIELVLGFPGGSTQSVMVIPGEPGKSAGAVKRGGVAVTGAKAVEAPRAGGYTLEAQIPWSAFPDAATVRVGLKAGVFVHDSDGGAVDAIVGSAAGVAHGSLAPFPLEAEQALAVGLLKQKSITTGPRYELLADVVGDSMKERVAVYEQYLVVLGPTFRKGTEYYWSDLGVDASRGQLPSLELRDLTGDGRAELVMRKRSGAGARYREVLDVWSFGANDTPSSIFRHEVAVVTESGSVENTVSFVPDGAKLAIKLEPGSPKRYDASSYKEPSLAGIDGVLLPWGSVKSRTFKLSGAAFTKASEETQAATPAPAPSKAPEPTPATPSPPKLTQAELAEKVLALYRKDRGQQQAARFDQGADLAGSADKERLLVIDRDLVIVGKSFKGGTGYAYLTMSQFAASSDVREVTTRDVTGDGKAEIVVRGVLQVAAPKELGGGAVEREVLVVYQVVGEGLKRVFAAELGRSMGKSKVSGTVTWGAGSIELGPGKATGWTEKTYPFGQDLGPAGGYEPLLLPWSGLRPARYKWTNGAFQKS